jgi:Na+-driven multidrug efflux pump
MATPAGVAALGTRYLGTYLLGAPLIFGYFAVDATFRAAGDTATPFRLLAGSVLVTLVADPVLIMGLGPFPRLGMAGAAIATVGTRSVAFALGVALLARRGMLRVDVLRVRPVATVLRVGLPTAVTGVMFSLIYVFVAREATRFGTPALAALGIGHRVESWLYTIGVGFGAAAAAIVGQNLGARELARAIIEDATGSPALAERHCRQMTHALIAQLPALGFELDRDDVLAWLEAEAAGI